MSIIKTIPVTILIRGKDLRNILIIIISILYFTKLKSQDIAPQIWNNANLGWNIDDRFALRNSLAYYVLLSEDFRYRYNLPGRN